jgi:cysteine synthase
VHSVGTAASSRGIATMLKRYRPSIQIVAVKPAESAVLSGGTAGPHKIEGVGIEAEKAENYSKRFRSFRAFRFLSFRRPSA